MSRVKITYLEEGGQYRRRRGEISGNLPNYLRNGADKQGHFLQEEPIFAEVKPVRVQSFRDLVEIDIPKQPRQVESRIVLIEANYPWPITGNPFQDVEKRDMDIEMAGEEASQKANQQASRADTGSGYTKGAYVGAAIVAGLFALLIVLILMPKILERLAA